MAVGASGPLCLWQCLHCEAQMAQLSNVQRPQKSLFSDLILLVVKLMIAALTCCCGNIQSVTENFAEAHCYCVLDGCTDGTTVCFIMTQSDP